MNKQQKHAVKEAMQYIDSVVYACTGQFSEEMGKPDLGEFGLLGIYNLQSLRDNFSDLYSEVFGKAEVVEDEGQLKFTF
jgi:hypothetical protein